MKRIVDIFTKDWASEIVWTYVISLGNEGVLTDIDAFEFKKLTKLDKGDDKLRRSIFTTEEMNDYWKALNEYLAEALRYRRSQKLC